MKKTTKKTAPKTKSKKTPQKKKNTVKKAKAFLAGAEATAKWSEKKSKPSAKMPKSLKKNEPHSLYMTPESDPAHSPGHRKMNLRDQFKKTRGTKNQPQNDSARNNMSKAERIQRTSATNRRIITGAAIGKTGQITIK